MPVVRRHKSLKDVPVSDEQAKVIAEIRKNKGERSVVMASQVRQPFRIRTNVFTLDYALLGGIPHNRTTMVHGKKHGGKTTLAHKITASAQSSMEGKPVWVDVEGTHDEVWARKNGVNTDELILIQPDTGEDAVDMTVGLVHAKETSLVIVDSLAALLPFKEQEGSAEDEAIPGLQAKLITRMMRRVSAALIEERKRDHFVSLLVLNQHRVKIGGYSPIPGQDPVKLPGGEALGHFTSVEIGVKNKENIDKNSGEVRMNEHSFRIDKNKCNAGIRSGEYQILRKDDPDLGLSESDVDDAGTMLVLAKRVGWYTGGGRGGFTLAFGDVSEHYANGDEAVRGLYANREVYEQLRIQLIVQQAMSLNMPEDFIDYLLGN